jgi:hypothetical protein
MHLANANGASSGSSDAEGDAELSAAGACDSRLATPDDPAPPAEQAATTVTRSSPRATDLKELNIWVSPKLGLMSPVLETDHEALLKLDAQLDEASML